MCVCVVCVTHALSILSLFAQVRLLWGEGASSETVFVLSVFAPNKELRFGHGRVSSVLGLGGRTTGFFVL